MSGKLIFGLMASVIMTGAWGASSTVTSRDYVDNALATKQVKIPSAGTAGATAGETVITYTASNGQVGERALFTGGTYDSSTDADKLITASALNGAVSNIPTTETSKLTCTDGNCLLWNIVTQTAYKPPFNPDVSINGTSACFRDISTNSLDGTCGADTLSYLGPQGNKSGKWGTVFPYGDVSGISVCSTVSASTMGTIATDAQSTTLDSEYAAQAGVGGNKRGNCWCKMENPDNSAARWVFLSSESVTMCAANCSDYCGYYVKSSTDFRGAVFGVN